MKIRCSVFLLFFSLLFFPLLTMAESVFRWEDSSGRVHYGSTPPPSVKNAKPVGGALSRYNADKALSGYGKIGSYTKTPSEKIETTRDEPAAIRPEKTRAILEQDAITLNQDERNSITSCKVSVKNLGKGSAQNVVITFQFKDGSLIQGEGPDTIDGLASVTYTVPAAHLPLKLDEGILSEVEKLQGHPFPDGSKWEPKVMIEYSQGKR